MQETRRKTLVYKRARFNAGDLELRRLLVSALSSRRTVGLRRETLAPQGESPIWRVIGYHKILEHFVFGVMMRYVPGLDPAFVIDDPDAEQLTVSQVTAPVTDEGKRRELLGAMLFFGSIDNHLVIMQSSSLRSKHLEEHLQWLLLNSDQMDDTQILQLIDQPPRATVDRLSQSHVKSIDIGGFVTGGGNASLETQHQTSEHEQYTIHSSGHGSGFVDFLKGLLKPDQAALISEEILAGAEIRYTLQLKYAHKTTEDNQRFMSEMASAFRHSEDVNTKIRLADGGLIDGDNFRLTGQVQIKTYDGVPNADEVFETMRVWLIKKLESGELLLP